MDEKGMCELGVLSSCKTHYFTAIQKIAETTENSIVDKITKKLQRLHQRILQ